MLAFGMVTALTTILVIALIGLPIVLFTGVFGIRYIPNSRVGMVEKRWSHKGSVPSGLIALRGEAGEEGGHDGGNHGTESQADDIQSMDQWYFSARRGK